MSSGKAQVELGELALSEFQWLPRWGLQLSERRALLVAGDVAMAVAATVLALYLWTLTSPAGFSLSYLLDQRAWFLWLIPAWTILIADLYDLGRAASPSSTLRGLLRAAGLGLALYVGVYFFSPPASLPRLVVLYFIGGAFLLGLTWRMVYIAVLVSHTFKRRALVVGGGWAGETIIRALHLFQSQQYAVVGVIDDDRQKHGMAVEGVPVLGGHETLPAAAHRHRASEIILAVTGEVQGAMFQALLDCQQQGLDIVRMPLLYEQITGQVPIQHLDADWMITSFVDSVRVNALSRGARRMIDLVGGVVGLLLLLLITPWVAAVVWLEDRQPLFYRQDRLGQGGKVFPLLKFRTMAPDAESDGQVRWAEEDDARVTHVGRLLRRMRLDEAPQFWNVLRGEMSLVGPRPERPEFVSILEREIPFYRARLVAKPGLTGWAQINYRYGNSVEDATIKLQYDLYYIKNRSLWLDLQSLARTLGVVLGSKGT